jgi:hypothetical protein
MIATAAVALLSAPAFAAEPYYEYNPGAPAEIGAGVVTGTVVGVGVSEGWFGATVAGTALPAGAVGAAATGGVVGVGTVAGIDSVIQPCRGFHAVFGMNRAECAARQQVAMAPQTTHRRTVHR